LALDSDVDDPKGRRTRSPLAWLPGTDLAVANTDRDAIDGEVTLGVELRPYQQREGRVVTSAHGTRTISHHERSYRDYYHDYRCRNPHPEGKCLHNLKLSAARPPFQ